jgi:hypothetical protein
MPLEEISRQSMAVLVMAGTTKMPLFESIKRRIKRLVSTIGLVAEIRA